VAYAPIFNRCGQKDTLSQKEAIYSAHLIIGKHIGGLWARWKVA